MAAQDVNELPTVLSDLDGSLKQAPEAMKKSGYWQRLPALGVYGGSLLCHHNEQVTVAQVVGRTRFSSSNIMAVYKHMPVQRMRECEQQVEAEAAAAERIPPNPLLVLAAGSGRYADGSADSIARYGGTNLAQLLMSAWWQGMAWHQRMSWLQFFVACIATALYHVHTLGHSAFRDLKLESCLFNYDFGILQLADFGLAVPVDAAGHCLPEAFFSGASWGALTYDLASLGVGLSEINMQYAATSVKLDSSSLGIMILHLLNGGVVSEFNSRLDWSNQEHWPCDGLQPGSDEFVQLQLQYAAELTAFYAGLGPSSPELAQLDPTGVQLILGLLHPDPELRWGMAQVLASPWLAPALQELHTRLAACRQQFDAEQEAMQVLALEVFGPVGMTPSSMDSADWHWEPERMLAVQQQQLDMQLEAEWAANEQQLLDSLQLDADLRKVQQPQQQQHNTCAFVAVTHVVSIAGGSTSTSSGLYHQSSSSSNSSVYACQSGSAEPCTPYDFSSPSQLSSSSTNSSSGRLAVDSCSTGASSCVYLAAQLQDMAAFGAIRTAGTEQHTPQKPFEQVYCCASKWWSAMACSSSSSSSNSSGSSATLSSLSRVSSAFRPDLLQLFVPGNHPVCS